MTRHVIRLGVKVADCKRISIMQNSIELTAISPEAAILVKNRAEGLLHSGNVATNRNVSREVRLNVRRTREMICMSMGLQDAIDGEATILNIAMRVSAESVERVPEA